MRADVARGFEEAVVDALAEKTRRALAAGGHRRLVVAGGVGANLKLRERLAQIAHGAGAQLYFPRIEFCTDNGAMIALAGCVRLSRGERQGLSIGARANWALGDLAPPGAGAPAVGTPGAGTLVAGTPAAGAPRAVSTED
jgi:N6-L-threonylcarbamoyladenine synthase